MGTGKRPGDDSVRADGAPRRQVSLGPSPFAAQDAVSSAAEQSSSGGDALEADSTQAPLEDQRRRGEWTTHRIPVAPPTVDLPVVVDPATTEEATQAQDNDEAAEPALPGQNRRQVRLARVTSRRFAWGVVIGGILLIGVIVAFAAWSLGNNSPAIKAPAQSESPNAATLSSKPPSSATPTAPESSAAPSATNPPADGGDNSGEGVVGTEVDLTAVGIREGDQVSITVVLVSGSVPVDGVGIVASWPDGTHSRCITVKGRCTTSAVTQPVSTMITVGSLAEFGYAADTVKIDV